MTEAEQRALLGISLMAASADGNNNDAEREHTRKLIERFANPGLNAMELYREVLLHRVNLSQLVQSLTPETRLMAYEMALGVAQADNHLNELEKSFLAELQKELGLTDAAVNPLRSQAAEIVSSALPPTLGATTAVSKPAPDASLDSTILNTAILAGALELLPGSLATMAIIPVQMRLVYRIGQHYGHQLDRSHIGEFLAAAGIGLTSQVLEGYATKLVKGLLGMAAGGLGRGIGGMFTGSAMSFATTYAIGQLAQRYYAGGRTLSGMQMQQTFQSLVADARGLQQQYLPQIQQRSKELNLAEIARLAGKS